MKRRLVVSPQLDLDVQAAAVWYDDQRSGLGLQFLHELDLAFQRIQDNPRQFPYIEGEVRRALLRRFPYGIYFVGELEVITVLAVLHLIENQTCGSSEVDDMFFIFAFHLHPSLFLPAPLAFGVQIAATVQVFQLAV